MGLWVSITLCTEGGECEGVQRLLFIAGLFVAFIVVCTILTPVWSATFISCYWVALSSVSTDRRSGQRDVPPCQHELRHFGLSIH
jgi:hypothetical protein